MKLVYLITGDVNEIAGIIDNVRKENRFMSDAKNVEGFQWYPLDAYTQVAELSMTKEVDLAELQMLTKDLTSITIGRLYDGDVYDVISDGATEVVNDSVNPSR